MKTIIEEILMGQSKPQKRVYKDELEREVDWDLSKEFPEYHRLDVVMYVYYSKEYRDDVGHIPRWEKEFKRIEVLNYFGINAKTPWGELISLDKFNARVPEEVRTIIENDLRSYAMEVTR